jgi:hypothetical protein
MILGMAAQFAVERFQKLSGERGVVYAAALLFVVLMM